MKQKDQCINCHFLCHRTVDGAKFDVGYKLRENLRKDKVGNNPGFVLCCFCGVWDEGAPNQDPRYERLIETDRNDFCFFWPYKPGMLFPAAQTLQEREAANRNASVDRHHTITGLWIAALALFINAIFQLPTVCQVVKALGWIK